MHPTVLRSNQLNEGPTHRAESAQQELEGSVNGLKKETGAQLRELASDRGEALRALEGAKQAAEHRQHQLQASASISSAEN